MAAQLSQDGLIELPTRRQQRSRMSVETGLESAAAVASCSFMMGDEPLAVDDSSEQPQRQQRSQRLMALAGQQIEAAAAAARAGRRRRSCEIFDAVELSQTLA
eukprot:gb/GFBE01079794.1/.p1 GENE.gb/GFBE01079794.1/~~gb/GFBE01079794.1/.p1  ORF type:complete len:103 (+),score=30.02 gb/GFBE01079794.1/:1-309(+)